MTRTTRTAERNRRRGFRGFTAALAASVMLAWAPATAQASDDGPGCGAAAGLALSGAEFGTLSRHLESGAPVTILAIGSSSTEGVGATDKTASYPAQLESDLRTLWRKADVTVLNAGIGGETADATVRRLENALDGAVKPDLVIWQVGTNDAVRGGDEAAFRALLERGIGAARRAGADLILLDQQFYPGIPDRARYERYVAMVAAAAQSAKAPLFSRYRLMKRWSDLAPGLLAAMLAKDQFHMGDRGYDCLASALGHELTAALAPSLRTGQRRADRPGTLVTATR